MYMRSPERFAWQLYGSIRSETFFHQTSEG